MPTEGPLTDAGLEIWPRGICDLVTRISRDYHNPIIEITESGCSDLDAPSAEEAGAVSDARRIAFFQQELGRAMALGGRVRAFHAWSLLDNFEWADGYTQRYGLTYVDFRDQKRTVKNAGKWCERCGIWTSVMIHSSEGERAATEARVRRAATPPHQSAAVSVVAGACASMTSWMVRQ